MSEPKPDAAGQRRDPSCPSVGGDGIEAGAAQKLVLNFSYETGALTSEQQDRLMSAVAAALRAERERALEEAFVAVDKLTEANMLRNNGPCRASWATEEAAHVIRALKEKPNA